MAWNDRPAEWGGTFSVQALICRAADRHPDEAGQGIFFKMLLKKQLTGTELHTIEISKPFAALCLEGFVQIALADCCITEPVEMPRSLYFCAPMRKSRIWILLICQVILTLVYPPFLHARTLSPAPGSVTILKAANPFTGSQPSTPHSEQQDQSETELPAEESMEDEVPLTEAVLLQPAPACQGIIYPSVGSSGYGHILSEIHTPPPEIW